MQEDPVKGASPWARGVIGNEQILLCPECQRSDPSWSRALRSCARCNSTRLQIQLGMVVCRQCGEATEVRA